MSLPALLRRLTFLILRLLLGLLVLALLAVGLLLATSWWSHDRPSSLPSPTGDFAVSRLGEFWQDKLHLDALAPDPAQTRELAVWIWYPSAREDAAARPVDYMPAPLRQAIEQRGGRPQALSNQALDRVQAHALDAAPVSAQATSWPVLLLRPGHSALTLSYSALAEDLASHGYVVVGFDAPYRSRMVVRPDGHRIERAAQNDVEPLQGEAKRERATRLVEAWADDARYVLDELARRQARAEAGTLMSRLDLQRVAMVGHSMGGATALEFCRLDARCRTGVDLDGAPFGQVLAQRLDKPFLFLLSDHSGEDDAFSRRAREDIEHLYQGLPPGRRWLLEIRGANHFFFSDEVATRSPVLLQTLHMLGLAKLDARHQLDITRDCLHRFLDQQLKDPAAPGLAQSLQRYPALRQLHQER